MSSYIYNFKKAPGGKMYCYGLTKSEYHNGNQFSGNVVTYIDTERYPSVFGKIDMGLSAVAVCIEPMNAEQHEQAQKGVKIERTQGGGFQDNSVCLLFNDVESIDSIINGLQLCKKRLKDKIKEREWEEYRKKYYGKVINFSDIVMRKKATTA